MARNTDKTRVAKTISEAAEAAGINPEYQARLERWARPHWQVELLEQQIRLRREVTDMQAARNSPEFHNSNDHRKQGLDKQLSATRNLLDVVNERISYFS